MMAQTKGNSTYPAFLVFFSHHLFDVVFNEVYRRPHITFQYLWNDKEQVGFFFLYEPPNGQRDVLSLSLSNVFKVVLQIPDGLPYFSFVFVSFFFASPKQILDSAPKVVWKIARYVNRTNLGRHGGIVFGMIDWVVFGGHGQVILFVF